MYAFGARLPPELESAIFDTGTNYSKYFHFVIFSSHTLQFSRGKPVSALDFGHVFRFLIFFRPKFSTKLLFLSKHFFSRAKRGRLVVSLPDLWQDICFCQMSIHFQCFLSLRSLWYLSIVLFWSLLVLLKVYFTFSAGKKWQSIPPK